MSHTGCRQYFLNAMFSRVLLSAFLLLVCVTSIQAHDARPLSVTLQEQTAGVYRAVVRAPPTLAQEDAPALIWPESCDILESTPLNLALGSISLVSCTAGLQGQTVRLQYPVFNPSLTTLYRLENLDGTSQTAVLPPDELAWQVPLTPSWTQVAADYTVIGIEHIWLGIDHLLFVAGLLLLARSTRRIVLAITGFTAAHSITLALATLELVRIPVSVVEALIALSIVFLAAEIARNDTDSFSYRYPILLSFAFGLLHGFGFASVLGDVGLPTNALITGLLFFNVGVELGQLAFIAFLVIVVSACRHLGRFIPSTQPASIPWAMLGAYVLGIPASYWLIERSLQALSV